MRFNDRARLDTSQVRDQRGSGGGIGGMFGGGSGGGGLGNLGGLAKGGGGLGIVIVIGFIIYSFVSGSGGSAGNVLNSMLGGSGVQAQTDNTQLEANCKTGADANSNSDCALVAIVNSVQAYWTSQLQTSGTTYRNAPTVWFTSSVQTGCGAASSGVGPFYCPADQHVYVDLAFFQTLKSQFKANDEIFTQAYVLAHEYGHHIQNLLGTSDRVGSATGPTSGSVRLELQADCYAGAWGHNATTVPGSDGEILVQDITQADLNAALQAADHIGDDYIQTNLGSGRPNASTFTHGTSEQRRHWFTVGYQSGNPADCNTFDTDDLG
jgi:predicted metalloprotease